MELSDNSLTETCTGFRSRINFPARRGVVAAFSQIGPEAIMITNAAAKWQAISNIEKLIAKYGCGAVHSSGTDGSTV